ncbi:hypothetical protein P8C59_008633 [Phyllachora maydis]|uniref:Uncharacterized protein n=1 Tax=Phyllachora maydis TaxID=1825666 RepID=A0AAD9IBU1_9PEZI|nr:hypothetical protein P8C59_008633 [Phyllachora maydis]
MPFSTDSFSNSDDSVYTILGISTVPPALAPTPAKPAKITPAKRRAAARKAKRRKSAKARTTAGRAAAAKRCKKRKEAVANAQARKLAKKEGLRRSKHTTSSNAGRYTTNSGLTANKDNNNAYNRAYMPPTNVEEEEEDSSSDNNSVNSSTSNSTDKGKGSSVYERGKSALYRKDILLYKRQYVASYPCSPPGAPCADIYIHYIQAVTAARPIIARYLKVLIAFKPASTEWRSAVRYVLTLPSSGKEEVDLAGIGKEALQKAYT